jgi:two-component system CheB/CheR fusion protein
MADAPEQERPQAAGDPGNAIPTEGYRLVPVVALGGSAGAIEHLQTFFRSVPPQPPMAFVVVMHLSAGHDSELAAMLQQCTRMPVTQVTQRVPIRPGHVYVIPPGKLIRSEGDSLALESMHLERGRHVAVDLMFRTMADSHGPHSAAVVLSGADGDGAIGIKRVKERGGLAIAQDPEECAHASMPRTAIATGMVDWTLPIAHMAPRLMAYFRLEGSVKLPSEDVPEPGSSGDETALREVLAFLRTRTGRDFSAYKRATIVRRIGRRMQVNGIDNLAAYLNFLRTRPGEAPALLQDLLISVTNFFRDADSFAALEQHLSELLRGKSHADAVRVWVAGCATGEEAYSIAIMLTELAREFDSAPQLQVFATDLDEDAIRVARDGLYPATIEADVSQERLRRFFTREHRGYRVRREIRELVLFAHHDVLKDSPFSRVDLVSCRNLLIYLTREAQQRVLQTFHFALKPEGLLFLGSSETCDESGELFLVADKKHRLFRQRPMARPALPVPTGPGTLAQALQPIAVAQPAIGGRSFDVPAVLDRIPSAAADRGLSWGTLHLKLLETLAPPSILVDAEHEIVHMSATAGRYLQFPGGEPSRNLLRTVIPDLRIELRAALYQAAQSGDVAEVTVPRVTVGGTDVAVLLRVWPVQDMGADLFMVLLDDRAPPAARGESWVQADAVATHLDRELERLKSQLRETVEQYETSTEELKASNEELQAINEELRSATEELETSREELQSINEELTTVNAELKGKVDELAHANSDMLNLMNATAIPTVFLDRALQIMRYTPTAVTLFNLIPSDIGRPLADLAGRVDYPELTADAARVLETLIPVEREVGLAEGTWFLARMLPYRTADDRIGGVVLSFVDITQRKQAEDVRLWLSAVVAAVDDAIISFAKDETILSWNAGAERILGVSARDAIGKPLRELWPAGAGEQILSALDPVAAGKTVSNVEARWSMPDGSERTVLLSASPIRHDGGELLGGTAVARDVTEHAAAASALRASEEKLRLIVENVRDYAIFATDLERRITSWNVGAERLLGYAEAEMRGQSADVIFTDEDRAAGAPAREAEQALGEGHAADDRVHKRKDGSLFWAAGMSMLMRDDAGEPVGFVKILRDQTAEREAEEALRRSQSELIDALADTQRARQQLEAADAAKDRFMAVLSHELRNPLASIASASELLMMPKLPEAALEKAAQVVQRQAKAMKVLLDELLDVSRLTLGRLTLNRRTITVAAFVQAAIETSRPLVQAAGHELSVELPPTPIEIDGDASRLAQVVSNLVTNAAKYTPEGGRVVVSAEAMQDEVVISVEDNGIGMDPSEIDRMFDLFSQGKGAMQNSNGGLGIGLALARNIVEMHGGWILASSAGPGKGSQFRVGLPLLRVLPQDTAETAEPEAGPLTPAAPASGELILVADDNSDAAWGLSKLLELSGYRALTARSGEEALRMAEEHRPAIALLDIGMPDLSGHEVARRIRQQRWGRAMILIAATGWGQESDVRESLAAGFDAHLTKPLNVGRIRSLIDELAQGGGNGKS